MPSTASAVRHLWPISQCSSIFSMTRARAVSPDLLIVQGQMHFYRIFKSDGRIERVSDNAVLELEWHSLPDQFQTVISREPDSEHQVQMRAFMLMNDGVFAQYFRAQF
jgi:hypothetical protein